MRFHGAGAGCGVRERVRVRFTCGQDFARTAGSDYIYKAYEKIFIDDISMDRPSKCLFLVVIRIL